MMNEEKNPRTSGRGEVKGLNDCRHMTAELDPAEQRAAAEKLARIRMIELLGDKYVLSRANSPVKGRYNPTTGARLS